MTDEALPPPFPTEPSPPDPSQPDPAQPDPAQPDPAQPESSGPEHPPIPLWTKWFAGIAAVLVVVGIAGSVIRLPYDTLSPGAALSVAPLVSVRGAKTYPKQGDVMLLFVRERDRVNVWLWLQAKLDPDIDLIKNSILSGGESEEQGNADAISEMTQSQISAKAAALTVLGYHLRTAPGLLVTAVLPSKPAGKVLQTGDQILAADGQVLKAPTDLSKIIGRHRVGTDVSLRIVRAGHTQTVKVGVALGENGKGREIGVEVLQTFRFPVRISVDTSNISGPSAGLAMTLAIIDDLTPGDLTGGKRVAVTGTITPNGLVGEIGGLPQKAVAARAAHAQIFIVPECVHDPSCDADLKTARERVGNHVEVKPVATLAQALAVLRAAGGSPVPTKSPI